MKLKMYSIRDQKTEVFNPPYFNHTHGQAERNFRDLVNEPNSQVSKHPTDYDLYYLGDYDDNTGKMDPKPAPEHLISAVNLIESKTGPRPETTPNLVQLQQ